MHHVYVTGLALTFCGVATMILLPGAILPGSVVATVGFAVAAIAAKAGE